jgi:hypothetical protein
MRTFWLLLALASTLTSTAAAENVVAISPAPLI